MRKITTYILATCAALTLGSCEKFLDINEDPSNPQVAEGYTLLPSMVANMARGVQFDSRFVGSYVQNWSSPSAGVSWDRHGFAAASDAGGEMWRSTYWSIGKNVDLMIEDGVAKQKWDYVGVAKAIRAWAWLQTTDLHGEIILKQAWEPNRYIFDYDSQEEVYAEVERLANDALADLNKTDGAVSAASLGRGDKVYNGDRTKWIKFTNGILARRYHHLTNKANYNADKVIELCDKSLATNADNFNVPHLGGSTLNANFYGPLRDNLSAYRQTDFALSLVDGRVFTDKDPRLPLLFTASADGEYRGVRPPSGDPNASPAANPKRIALPWGVQPSEVVGKNPADVTKGKYIFRDNAGFPIITAAEIQFIKAEAALKKGDKALAAAAYMKGMEFAMEFAGVAAADRAKFSANTNVARTAANITLSDIMLQKYIALWGHGALETWTDMRRFAYNADIYKGFTPPAGTSLAVENGGKLVQRLRPRYNSEYVWNLKSLAKIGGDKLDYHTYEMWFSKP